MKKKRKKSRRGISGGTLAMLLLTALVLAGCAAFMVMIAGEELQSRAGELMQMIEETGVSLISEAESSLFGRETSRPSIQPMPTPQNTHSEEPPQLPTREISTFTLAAAGTVYAPKAIRTGAQRDTGEYDFTSIFEGLGDVLSGADLAIATLETMTAGEEKGYGNYNAPVQLLDALRACGIDLISLGTERVLDKGYEGLQITTGELTARGMAYAGVSMDNDAAGRTNLIGIDGIQVAVLAYTYGLSNEGKESAAEEERGVVSMLETERMAQEIRQARVDGANVVIVLPHWGTKNIQETPDEVREMARLLATAGADVILGTHPNVVQGTERLRVTRADGLEYDTVVCYSLGSLLSDARIEENTAGMIAHLKITYDPATRRVSLGSLACSPVYIARQKSDGQNIFRVIDVENVQAIEKLDEIGREEAQRAAKLVREVTGQRDMEGEGQG